MRGWLVGSKENSKECRSSGSKAQSLPLGLRWRTQRSHPPRAEIQISSGHSRGSRMAEKSPWCHAVEFSRNVPLEVAKISYPTVLRKASHGEAFHWRHPTTTPPEGEPGRAAGHGVLLAACCRLVPRPEWKALSSCSISPDLFTFQSYSHLAREKSLKCSYRYWQIRQ